MMMMTLVCGVIGIAMMGTFLGFMVGWVKALPLIIIVVVVMLLLVWDWIQEVRADAKSANR